MDISYRKWVIKMRNCKADFEDTCKLMRRYMKHIQPQSFASVWGIFEKQKKQCELNKISIDDVSDIYNYAKVEQIEKFGFWNLRKVNDD